VEAQASIHCDIIKFVNILRFLCLIGCFGSLLFGNEEFFGSRCFARAFEVSGVFENTITGTNGEPVLINGCFTVVAEDCKWRIRTKRFDESVDFFEAGSTDGKQIYLLASHTNITLEAIAELKDPVKAAELDVAFAQITPGEVPHFRSAEQICILWLAYASSCYFATRTNDQIEPVYWFGGEYFFNRGLTVPGNWQIEKASPHLPSRVVFFNDGFLRAMDRGRTPVITPNSGVYAKGFTNAVYQVTQFSEVNSFKLPSEFTLSTYRPKPSGTEVLVSGLQMCIS